MMRSYQYQFDLDLNRVHLQIPFGCFIELWWRKGNKKITTKKRIELTGKQRWFDVGERLSMIASCHADSAGFAAKPSILNVVILTANNPNKSGGYYSLELTDVLKVADPMNPCSRAYDVGIQNCPTANGRIQFTLSARCLHEVNPNHSFENGLSTPNRNHSMDMTFRAEQLDLLNSGGGLANLDFSFQQTFPKTRSHAPQLMNTMPVSQPPTPKPVDNQTFYQLLQTKRKLDQRNMEFAKLHNDYILQLEKQRLSENQSKHREVRLMNEVNVLNQEVARLKKQLSEQSIASAQHNMLAARSKEELKKAQQASQKLQELQSQVYRKQAEMICIQNTMSNRLKEAVANNQRLSEKLNQLNMELRGQYERTRELERHKLQLETSSLREKEAYELKMKVLEEKAKQKDTIIDAVRKDFQRFSTQKNDNLRRLKQAEQGNRNLVQQAAMLSRQLEIVKAQQQIKLTEQAATAREIEQQKNKLKSEHDYVVQEMLKRIKGLQQALQEKAGVLSQKQQIIDKAKDYVNFKEDELQRRDQFIARAKEYIQDKEAEMTELKEQHSKQTELIAELKTEVSFKDQQLKLMEASLSSSKTDSSSVLATLNAQKDQYARRQQQTLSQLQECKQEVEKLRAELTCKAAYCIQVQLEGQSYQLKCKQLQRKLEQKEIDIFSLSQQLEESESDHLQIIGQVRHRMQETMKQNAQYQIQISIYSREVKTMQELLEKAQKKLVEDRERSLSVTTAQTKLRQPLKEQGQEDRLIVDRSKYSSFIGQDSAQNSRVA